MPVGFGPQSDNEARSSVMQVGFGVADSARMEVTVDLLLQMQPAPR